MTNIRRSSLGASAALAAAFLILGPSSAIAQKRPKSVDTGTVQVTKRTTKPPRPVGAPRPVVNVARTGLIVFGPILENAKVLVDDKPAKDVTIDRANNRVLVDDVLPGKRKITYDAPDYVIVEKLLTVKAGAEHTFFVTPEEAVSTLVVKTEPDTAVFVDGEPRGRTPASGTLTLNEVKLGAHEVKLVKATYEEYKETKTFEFGVPVTMTAKLVPLPSSAEFNDLFDINLNKWTKPATGWTLKSGRLVLANAPLGYATGVNYRDVAAMAFHLRLDNGGGAAWAVRVKDSNNYYLFYLSGPKGLYPGTFNTYVVRDGKLDLQDPASSVPVIENLTAGGEYDIMITATGNVIEHEITPATTGRPIKLGVFKDPSSAFLFGGIGFRTVGTEQFQVDDLYVQPK